MKADHVVRRAVVDPHPDILELRRALKFDYGKFDYVVHDGRACALDVNKTPGEGRTVSAGSEERLRHRAAGLYSFLNGGAPCPSLGPHREPAGGAVE